MGTLLTVNHEGARYNGETVTPGRAHALSRGCSVGGDLPARPSTFVNVFAPDTVNKWLAQCIMGLIEA